MTDERRRDLERQAADGDLAARSAALIARARAGAIPPARLELAAFLGDAAARSALGRLPSFELPDAPRRSDGRASRRLEWGDRFAAELVRHGADAEALVRAAHAAAASTRDALELELGAYATLIERALATAEAWVRCPCDGHRAEASRVRATHSRGCIITAQVEADGAAHAAAGAAGAETDGARLAEVGRALDLASVALPLDDAAEAATSTIEAIARAVVPWAVGDADPLGTPRRTVARARLAALREAAPLAADILGDLLAGRRSHWDVQVAAHLGAADACAALAAEPADDHEVVRWLLGLPRWGRLRLVEAAVAVASAVPRDELGERALACARTSVTPPFVESPDTPAATDAALQPGGPPGRRLAGWAAESSRTRHDALEECVRQLVATAHEAGLDDAAIRAAVRQALFPQLLGESPPA